MIAPPTLRKPGSWNWSPAAIGPEWEWFVHHAEIIFPFWRGRALVPWEITKRKLAYAAPSNTAGDPSMVECQYGSALRADTGDILRYTIPGSGAGFFNKDEVWSAGAVVRVEGLATDQQTIFGQSAYGLDAAQRRCWVAVQQDGDVEIRSGPEGIIVDGAGAGVSDGDTCCFCIACDGAQTFTLWVYNLDTERVLVNGGTGTMTVTGTSEAELHLLAHYTETNDDLDGDMFLFWKLEGWELNDANARQIMHDPFGMLRPAERSWIGKAPAAPAPVDPRRERYILGAGF